MDGLCVAGDKRLGYPSLFTFHYSSTVFIENVATWIRGPNKFVPHQFVHVQLSFYLERIQYRILSRLSRRLYTNSTFILQRDFYIPASVCILFYQPLAKT